MPIMVRILVYESASYDALARCARLSHSGIKTWGEGANSITLHESYRTPLFVQKPISEISGEVAPTEGE